MSTSLAKKAEEYAGLVFDSENELAEVERLILERSGELIRDSSYEQMTNDRSRKAFVDEYLSYDGFIERKMKLEAKRDYHIRMYTITEALLRSKK